MRCPVLGYLLFLLDELVLRVLFLTDLLTTGESTISKERNESSIYHG